MRRGVLAVRAARVIAFRAPVVGILLLGHGAPPSARIVPFTLPLRGPTSSRTSVACALICSLTRFGQLREQPVQPRTHANQQPARPRVLVVEDDAAIRDMLTDEVTPAGVTVEQVSNGVYGTLAGVRL